MTEFIKETRFWLFKDHPNKQNVIDKYREYHVESWNWWEDVYEQWREDCQPKGFSPDLDATFFRGFSSQGDGAAFYELEAYDAEDLLKEFDFSNRYTEKAAMDTLSVTIEKNSFATHYCHHKTFYAEVSIDWDDAEGYLRMNAVDDENKNEHVQLGHQLEGDMDRLQDFVTAIFSDAAQNLYSLLEEQYDGLTSDEYLTEWLMWQEDMVFDADGNGEDLPLQVA